MSNKIVGSVLLSLVALVLLSSFSHAAFAQDSRNNVPVGLWTDSFLDDVSGKAIVFAGNSSLTEMTESYVKATIESMRASKRFSLVMDASPLGDLSALSDVDRMKKAKQSDAKLWCKVSAFDAKEAPPIVIRCETQKGSIEFIGDAGDPNSFFMKKTVDLAEKKTTVNYDFKDDVVSSEFPKPVGANILALDTLTTAKSIAFELEKRTYEGARQMLAHSPITSHKRRIVAGVGEPIRHDVFYELIERPELAEFYRKKNRLKTTLFISSASLIALGVGLTFVGLAANAGCDSFGCRTVAMPVAGGSALVLGLGGVTWGFLTKKYPTSQEEDLQFIDDYNDKL